MSLQLYLTYLAACVAIVIVPGPSVTVIIANSLAHGPRAGLLNVAGTQFGLLIMSVVLVTGLTTIINHAGAVFDIVRILGAFYLIWLGYKLWTSDGRLADAGSTMPANGRFFLQGLLVVLSNPKALLFFGAFIPQFIDPSGYPLQQTCLLAGTFMVVAALLDGAYALAAGWAGDRLTRKRVKFVERLSGTFLVAGGIWLAFTRRT